MFNEFKLISRAIKRMFRDMFQGILKHCRIHLQLETIGKWIVRSFFILLAAVVALVPPAVVAYSAFHGCLRNLHPLIVISIAFGCAAWIVVTIILSCTVSVDYYEEERTQK